jgi:thiamine-monophosphate kinase
MPGEFDLIRWIQTQHKPSDLVQTGPGDDMAVVKWPAGDLLLVGVDQVLDGVHFDSTIHPPKAIGRKVMNRNLSDCAAMACLPAAAVATVALPRTVDLEYAKELYRGMRDAAEPFACDVVGGDTGSWEGMLAMTVTILGRSAGVPPVLRKGARPGDGIYVTGPLGGSILGRHMTFTPRVFEAAVLVRNQQITSMIDLSDGLSRDIRHICEQSSVGAVIEAAAIPIHDDAIMASRRDRRIPLEHALHDGEDYELLFTTPATNLPHVRIGMITAQPGIYLERDGTREPLEPKGWEHTL